MFYLRVGQAMNAGRALQDQANATMAARQSIRPRRELGSTSASS